MIPNTETELKDIFGATFTDSSYRNRARKHLVAEITDPSVFFNEYYIFYNMLREYPTLRFSERFLSITLQKHSGALKANPQIDLSDYSIGDNNAYEEFCKSCLALFAELSDSTVSEDSFDESLVIYKQKYLDIMGITVLETASTIMTEGAKPNGKQMVGFADARNYVVTEMTKLEKMTRKNTRKGIIAYGVTDREEETRKLRKLGNFGIKFLDDVFTLYSSWMVNIMAPPKGGKSRFCVKALGSLLIDQGVNCLIWSTENGVAGWEAMFRAHLFNKKQNDVSDVRQRKFLDDSMILTDTVPAELKQIEESCWFDFRNNAKYGRLVTIDEDLNYDNYLEILEEAVDTYNIDVICIDYLQLMAPGVNQKSLSKAQFLGEVYRNTLQFLKRKDISGLFPCQFKQTVINTFSNLTDAELLNLELRDSGGETAEAIRTPDVNFGLIASTKDLREGHTKLIHAPSRCVKPFAPVDMDVDFGICEYVGKRMITGM